MASRSTWLRWGLVLFSAAIMLQGVAERRPYKLAITAATAVVFIAVVGVGWLFATKRER